MSITSLSGEPIMFSNRELFAQNLCYIVVQDGLAGYFKITIWLDSVFFLGFFKMENGLQLYSTSHPWDHSKCFTIIASPSPIHAQRCPPCTATDAVKAVGFGFACAVFQYPDYPFSPPHLVWVVEEVHWKDPGGDLTTVRLRSVDRCTLLLKPGHLSDVAEEGGAVLGHRLRIFHIACIHLVVL